MNWKEQLKEPVFEETDLFSDIIIPNVEVTRLCYIFQINMLEEKPVLFIGDSGTGKTAVVKYFLTNYMDKLAKKYKIQGYIIEITELTSTHSQIHLFYKLLLILKSLKDSLIDMGL